MSFIWPGHRHCAVVRRAAHATAKRRSYSVCRAAHAAVPASGPATKVGDVLTF